MGVQQCPHLKRGRMEGGLYHQRRTIRTDGHVLWSNELPGHLPNDDERHLPRRNTRGMAHCLYGRYVDRHRRQPSLPSKRRPPSPHQAGPLRSFPQTREMRLRTKTYRIPRRHFATRNHPHGPDQNARSSGLATADYSDRRSVIPRFYGVLSILHPQLLQNCKTPPTVDEKRLGLGVGTRPKTSVRTLKDVNVSTPSTCPTELQQTIRRTHRRIGLWRGRHTLTRGRNAPKRQNLETITPPHSLLLSHVHSSRKKL